MPSNTGDDVKEYLITTTEKLKTVSDYTNLSFNECMELDCFTFKMLLRDAFIYKMRQTKEGREYLEECWIINQTSPDRKKLRKIFGGDNFD